MRQVLPDPAGRLDEIDGIVIVFVDAGSDRENVRVKDDVPGGKPTCSVRIW